MSRIVNRSGLFVVFAPLPKGPKQRSPDELFLDAVDADKKGEKNEAVMLFRLAAACPILAAEAWNCIGSILHGQDKLVAAEESLRNALAANQLHAAANYNLGLCLMRKPDHNEAVKHFLQAVAVQPNYADAHYNLGLSYASIGDSQKAVDHYRLAKQYGCGEPDWNMSADRQIALLRRYNIHLVKVKARRRRKATQSKD